MYRQTLVGGATRTAASLAVLLTFLGLGATAHGESGSRQGPPPGIDPADYSADVRHPLVPLSSVRLTVFEGRERDRESGRTIKTRVVSRVLKRTSRVAGVEVAVVSVREYEDGELVERTTDYFAQDREGSVWYFGERVDDYEDGRIVGHEGAWLAGEGNAQPGLFMPVQPKVGQVFEQERAPGVAEDRSTVVAVGLRVKTPAGRRSSCIKTRDRAPLDRRTEFKYYCSGVGLVREQASGTRLDLIRYS